MSAPWASPHTRGWTLIGKYVIVRTRGFPADAGMDPINRLVGPVRQGLPRTRGDGPSWVADPQLGAPASPHTRGWTPVARVGAVQLVGFPAHAGMDRGRSSDATPSSRLPRTRGDGPVITVRLDGHRQASPHTRGWTF